MRVDLAVRPLDELTAQYGPMRTVLHHAAPTAIPEQQYPVFVYNLLGGRTLRESVINGTDGTPDLFVRFVKYIDPVSRWDRFAVDYWSVNGFWAVDHIHRAVAEAAYEAAVRAEFAKPTLPHALERPRHLAGFYDVTDVA
ncbi:hypothetical protein ACFW5V_32370 [Streptomyces sp. NPDC058762]|uniref:hypothetical protein n=1 Tax=Streptomyces sp. NPDC058762 TaxID=3346629 RepID=UPI0036C65CE0